MLEGPHTCRAEGERRSFGFFFFHPLVRSEMELYCTWTKGFKPPLIPDAMSTHFYINVKTKERYIRQKGRGKTKQKQKTEKEKTHAAGKWHNQIPYFIVPYFALLRNTASAKCMVLKSRITKKRQPSKWIACIWTSDKSVAQVLDSIRTASGFTKAAVPTDISSSSSSSTPNNSASSSTRSLLS